MSSSEVRHGRIRSCLVLTMGFGGALSAARIREGLYGFVQIRTHRRTLQLKPLVVAFSGSLGVCGSFS